MEIPKKKSPRNSRKFASGRCAWCSSITASASRSRPQSSRSPARSAALHKCCPTGCTRTSPPTRSSLGSLRRPRAILTRRQAGSRTKARIDPQCQRGWVIAAIAHPAVPPSIPVNPRTPRFVLLPRDRVFAVRSLPDIQTKMRDEDACPFACARACS